MNCWHCNTYLEMHSEQTIEEHKDYYKKLGIHTVQSAYLIITNLTCPNCHSFVEIYKPTQVDEKHGTSDI